MALKDPKGSNRDNEGEEIEDIDSDDEIALAYQLEQQRKAQQQKLASVKVPGLSLGGLGAPSHFTMQ